MIVGDVGLPPKGELGQIYLAFSVRSILTKHVESIDCVHLWYRSYREYEDRAVALAQNTTRWETVRECLLDKVRSSPLFDMQLYVRDLERAWHAIWELHAAGMPPQHIHVVPLSGA